jgi:surfactin synthase thioesterase subunit
MNENLKGGTLAFHLLQNIFCFKTECDKKCLQKFNDTFTYNEFEKDLFYISLKNFLLESIDETKPILIFFCGLGVQNVQYRIKDYLVENCNCMNSIIFSMHLSKIHDLNEMISKAQILYQHAKNMFPKNNFIFVGHSLGSGIALQTCKEIYEKETNPRIQGILLISTYPNLSFTFEKTKFKNLINYAFNNILDNEKAMQFLKTKIQKKNFILILQGDNDKIFNCKHIQEMIDNNNLINFASLEIIKGDHFYPAEFKVWCKLLCNF